MTDASTTAFDSGPSYQTAIIVLAVFFSFFLLVACVCAFLLRTVEENSLRVSSKPKRERGDVSGDDDSVDFRAGPIGIGVPQMSNGFVWQGTNQPFQTYVSGGNTWWPQHAQQQSGHLSQVQQGFTDNYPSVYGNHNIGPIVYPPIAVVQQQVQPPIQVVDTYPRTNGVFSYRI